MPRSREQQEQVERLEDDMVNITSKSHLPPLTRARAILALPQIGIIDKQEAPKSGTVYWKWLIPKE